jgi:sugar phosphate isomerase/epimerase
MRDSRFSVCQFTSPRTSFAEDLLAFSRGGATGIGICEFKLAADDAEGIMLLESSGLQATYCIPAVQSILPLGTIPGPTSAAERIDAISSSVRRFARYGARTVVVVTGPAEAGDAEARQTVVDGLRQLCFVGSEVGVDISVEPIHRSIATDWSIIWTLQDTIALLDEIGAPNAGVLFDIWHLWDTPDLIEATRQFADRINGVHICDWREPPRSWADRVAPGDGSAPVAAIIEALELGRYDGFYELEIFSDDGFYGNDYPDSLWKLPPVDLIRTSREKFLRLLPT